MPALDTCEKEVIAALEKAGYRVTDKPYPLLTHERTSKVFADMRLEQTSAPNQSIIVVEVKCFNDLGTALDELYGAFGQYLLYRSAMRLMKNPEPLYLSVPNTIWETLFQRDAVQSVVVEIGMKIIIVDLEREEIVGWKL